MLYIDKEESVKRQMRRGQLALHHNEMVANTGIGSPKPVRETDLSPTLAAERYKMFKEQVYESLKVVKSSFHFHFINGHSSHCTGGASTHGLQLSCRFLSAAHVAAPDFTAAVSACVHLQPRALPPRFRSASLPS